jgi:hypothetical protein
MTEDRSLGWSAAWGVVALAFGAVAAVMWAAVVTPTSSGLALLIAIITSVIAGGGLYMCFAALTGTWPANRLLSQRSKEEPENVAPPVEPTMSARDIMLTRLSELGMIPPVEPTMPVKNIGNIPARGERLSAGEFLCSRDGTVIGDMQRDGNLVVRLGTKTLWDSRTAMMDGNYLEFLEDGNLLLCDWQGGVWIDWRATEMGGKFLTMRDDGNLVLYADEGRTVWATDRLKDGRVITPNRSDLRAYPKRRMMSHGGQIQWLDL